MGLCYNKVYGQYSSQPVPPGMCPSLPLIFPNYIIVQNTYIDENGNKGVILKEWHGWRANGIGPRVCMYIILSAMRCHTMIDCSESKKNKTKWLKWKCLGLKKKVINFVLGFGFPIFELLFILACVLFDWLKKRQPIWLAGWLDYLLKPSECLSNSRE